MNHTIVKNRTHPVLQFVRNFINKFTQSPDVYPIKYYKKGKGVKRNWHGPLKN